MSQPLNGAPAVPPAHAPVTDEHLEKALDLRGLVLACYVLFLLAVVNGLTAILGLVIAYVKRGEAEGTIWRSHFDNLILVFWILGGAVMLGTLTWPFALGAIFAPWPFFFPALTLPFVFGLIVFPVLAIWYFYRVIRGLIRAGEHRAY